MSEDQQYVACGRCGERVRKRVAELCWYCSGYLCGLCWDEYGHCGHPEAEKFNQQDRLAHKPAE